MCGSAAKSQNRPTTNAEGQYSNESAVLVDVELLVLMREREWWFVGSVKW